MTRSLRLLLIVGVSVCPLAEAQTGGGALTAYPIDLTAAFRLAGAHNLAIAEAEARVREASGEALTAYERFLPSLSGEFLLAKHEGRLQATDGFMPDVDKQFNRIGGHLYARWDLNNALFSVLAARRRHRAAAQTLEAATDSALMNVADAYFDLVFADAALRMGRRAVAISTDLTEQTARSVDDGVGFKVDLLRARSQLAHDRLALHHARETMATASAHLGRLLSLEESVELSPLDTTLAVLALIDTTDGLDHWLSESALFHPAIGAGIAARDAARWEKRQAIWGPLFPEVEGHAYFMQMDTTLSNLRRSRDYTLSVKWTLGPGGLFDFGRIRTRSARATIAAIRLEAAADAVAESVIRSYSRLRERGAMVDIAEGGLQDALQTYELASGRRALGIAIALEVIDAAETLMRAEGDYARAVTDYNRAQVEALAALGQLRDHLPVGNATR